MEHYIAHHGVKGQKWGVRRYRNPDGSLTSIGRIHYGIEFRKEAKRAVNKNATDADRAAFEKKSREFIERYGSDEYFKAMSGGAVNAGIRALEGYGVFLSTKANDLMRRTWLSTGFVYGPGQLQKEYSKEIEKAEKEYYTNNKNGDIRKGYSSLVKTMRKDGVRDEDIIKGLGLTKVQFDYVTTGRH